jgi:hypothetical protein
VLAKRAPLDFLEFESMNKFSMAGMCKGLMMASLLALIAPNTSWADDHLLSVNGATVITPATITHAGAVTQPMILASFDGNPTLALGQSQTLTVVSALVKLCKPGTRNELEWLDQGNTVVGVTGTLTSGTSSTVPTDGYRLTLTMTGITDTYGSSSGPCTVSGQKTFAYTAGAVIAKQTGSSGNFTTVLSSTYNIWNPIGRVPEPGTALLMAMGLLVLGWMNMKRVRTVRGAST